jgi:hypothetical protein
VLPDRLDDPGPGDRLPGPLEQELEQGEFTGSEPDDLTGPGDAVRYRIENEIAAREGRARPPARRRTARTRATSSSKAKGLTR